MRTIFDGLDRLSDEEICGQIALMRCVTLSNTIKERSQKAFQALVETAGGILGMNSSSGGNDDGLVMLLNIRKMIDECREDLEKNDREELDNILKQELIKKCNSILQETLSENVGKEELYIVLVREASKLYRIDENKTPAQQADEVHDRYYEQYLKVLQKRILKMSSEERTALELRIQRAITTSDINQMRQLARELMLREFNGKTILMKILVSKDTVVLRRVVNSMGLSLFDGIDGVISTVYDSMLSLNRVERVLLAQVVWTACNGLGEELKRKDDCLPSYSPVLLTMDEEKERRLLTYIAREKQLNKELKDILKEIDKNNKILVVREGMRDDVAERLTDLKQEYKNALAEQEQLRIQGERVRKVYDEYIKRNGVRNSSDVEFRRIRQDYENTARDIRNSEYRIQNDERNISRQENELEKVRFRIQDINKQISEMRETMVNKVTEFNELIVKLENEAEYFSQILSKRWENNFKKLKIGNGVCENTVKCMTQREVVALERLLCEMDDCENTDYFAKHRGEYQSITYCMVATGKYAKITYHGYDIIDIGVKERD
ncbi:MAG: hypothetical protein ACI4AQ_05265 [Lachnospiraceae bacterium]